MFLSHIGYRKATINCHKKMNRFKEVDINRVFSIFLIVILHSLAFYTGAWAAPDDFQPVGLYKYLGMLCGSVAVPSFVFISGFLFRSQISTKNLDFVSLIKKKSKRLLFPSVIFSILYVLLFNEEIFSLSSLFDILNGAGHLWFLPMLFWCFCVAFYLFKLPNRYSLLIAVLLVLFGGGYLPFGISRMFYYLIYFILGGVCYSSKLNMKKFSYIRLTALIFGFLFFFGIENLMKENMFKILENHELLKVLINRGQVIIRVVYGCLGVVLLYILSTRLSRYDFSASPFFQLIVRLSFGIYIYHQFILVFLYRKLNLYDFVGPYLLPIIGFALAITLSFVLAYLTNRTKIGRQFV